MPKLHIHNLYLGAIAAKLYVSLGCQQTEEKIILAFKHNRQLSDLSLNQLYTVIKHRP
jgi:hypothetical protein